MFTYENNAPALRDSSVVQYFRISPPDIFLGRLNTDLGISLTVAEFLRIQAYFSTIALRDPTVGELRLLDALCRRGGCTPERVAVGELITDSPAVAETWADMMAKHGALNGSSAAYPDEQNRISPCTLSDALNLTGRYLYGVGIRSAESTLMLSNLSQETAAAAAGYSPVARVQVGDSIRSLWERTATVPETPCRAGDMLLYLPRLTLRQLRDLLAAVADRRLTIGAVRSIANESLLSVALELCPAADLYAARFPGVEPSSPQLPLSILCGRSAPSSDGTCGYLLRIPLRQMPTMTQTLKERGISFVACGQARADGNLTVLLPDMNGQVEYAVVSLPPDLLRSMLLPQMCTMNPKAWKGPVPEATCLPLSRLPSQSPESDGLTPDGREVVALTLQGDSILTIPEKEVRMTARKVEIPFPTTAYSAAAETTAAAALALEREGIAPAAIRLSAVLSVSEPSLLTDGSALSAVCGVYCAAAQLAVPVENSVVETAPSALPITLTITAWAKEPLPLSSADDRQWRTSSEAVHKEAPAYFLPSLRRVSEGSLLSLCAALKHNRAAACALRPLAVNAVTDEETGTPHYSLHPDSLQKLLEELNGLGTPVFALNRGDTRLLLAHPEVREALLRREARGGRVLVLGEACAVFAEHGLLPAALAEVHPVPVGGHTAEVTYTFPASPASRLLRADPLAPDNACAAMEIRHLLELHLPDGAVIPDGFLSESGGTLALQNGLDTTVLARV